MAKLNKKLIYKFGVTAGSVAAIVAPVATLVSCSASDSDNPGDSWQFGSHRFVQQIIVGVNDFEAASAGPHYFAAPQAYSYDASSSAFRNSELLFLFRPVKDQVDKPVYTTDPSTGEKTLSKVVPFRTTKFRFSLVNGFIITHDDNSTTVIDNDSLTENEAGSTDKWHRSINYSVNGEFDFLNQIYAKGAKNIAFTFRDDLASKHWIQQTTGRKGASLSPEDIFAGMMLNISYNSDLTASRLSGLRSSEFESLTKVINSIAPNANFKAPKGATADSIIWSSEVSSGLDISAYKTADSSKVIKTDNNGKKTYNFDFKAGTKEILIAEFFKKNLMFKPIAGATSHVEIENLISKYSPELTQKLDAVPELHSRIDDIKKSTLWKSGYLHWLIAKRDEHYVAGQYYIAHSETKELVVEQNPEFIDERWLNQVNSRGEKTSIKTYKYKFIDSDSQAQINVLNAYKMGTGVLGYFNSLSVTDKVKAIENPHAFGITYTTPYTSSKQIGGDHTVQQLMPLLPSSIDGNVYFNDNYAKVMWGRTISELKSGQDVNGDWVKSIFAGNGFQFRNNIDAVINEYSAIQNFAQGAKQEWFGPFAPEGEIKAGATPISAVILQNKLKQDPNFKGDTPAEQEVISHIKEYLQLSSKWAVRIQNGLFDFQEVTRDEFIAAYSDAQISHYGPTQAKFDIIKRNIKEVLDRAGIPMDQKVTWEYAFGRGMTSATYNPEYRGIMAMINSLDPRLNVVAEVTPIKETQSGVEPTVKVSIPDNTYSVKGTTLSSNPIWLGRLFSRQEGYNGWTSSLLEQYSDSTPASPIMDSLGDLQLGRLQGLSYYSVEGKNMIDASAELKPLQHIISALETSLTALRTSFWGASNFHSKFGSSIVQDLNGFKFEDIWKSQIVDLANLDYLGFKGLENTANEYKVLSAKTTLTDDEKSILDDITYLKNSFNSWWVLAKNALKDEFASANMHPSDIAQVMNAFKIISPKSLNPLDNGIGNRERVAVSLAKNWFTDTGYDSYSTMSLSRIYVDLDKDNDGNPILENIY